MKERVLRIFILLIGYVIVAGCNKLSQEEDEIIEATRRLAPEGGAGTIDYFYESGELKQRSIWQANEIVRIEYFDRNGILIHEAIPVARRSLIIEFSESGDLIELSDTKDFVKHGSTFRFEDGRLIAIEKWDYDKGRVKTYGIPARGDRKSNGKPSLETLRVGS